MILKSMKITAHFMQQIRTVPGQVPSPALVTEGTPAPDTMCTVAQLGHLYQVPMYLHSVFQTFFCLQGINACLGPQQGSDTISGAGSLLENAGKQLHSALAPYPTAVLIGRGGTPAPDTSVPAAQRYTLYQVPMYLHPVFQTFSRWAGDDLLFGTTAGI